MNRAFFGYHLSPRGEDTLCLFPEGRFCHGDNPVPVEYKMGKDEKAHDNTGNVMDFRERGHRNNQKDIPEKPSQLRDLDDPGNKCQKKCDDQPAIDEIIQPAFACHRYPAWNVMDSNELSMHVHRD